MPQDFSDPRILASFGVARISLSVLVSRAGVVGVGGEGEVVVSAGFDLIMYH